MPRTLLTVPVGHESGLTSTSLGLVRGLDRIGINVGFYKPLTRQTGEERSTALIRLTTSLRPPDPLPAEHLEERLSAGALNDLMEEVVARGAPVFDAHDVVIIEGVDPSTTQLYSGRVNGALAKALDADVILVSSAGDDEPEHVAETLAIASDQYRVGEQVRVIGCVVNRMPAERPGRREEAQVGSGRPPPHPRRRGAVRGQPHLAAGGRHRPGDRRPRPARR